MIVLPEEGAAEQFQHSEIPESFAMTAELQIETAEAKERSYEQALIASLQSELMESRVLIHSLQAELELNRPPF